MSEAKEKAKKEAARIDMKQHANKLIQGFEKLDESDAKRAIWELLQNAVDVSENCEIIISITDKSLIFQHNGKPFTTTTLNSLIKQVSSKASQNNDDEVGQYGTGFITTHSFGKKILLSGSLKKEEGYIYFDNFEIDRTAKDSDELIEKLIIQQEKAFDLIDINDTKEEPSKFTTFEYLVATDLEKENLENKKWRKNMLTFAMTTTTKLAGLSLYEKDKLLGEIHVEMAKTHSTTILEQIDSLLKWTGKKLDEIENVLVSIGPGSFTGVRIAISVVKGLFFGRNVNFYEVNELDALGFQGYYNLKVNLENDEDVKIYSLIDSRKEKIYCAAYETFNGKAGRKLELVKNYEVTKLDNVIEEIIENKQDKENNKKIYLIGDAVFNYKAKILDKLGYFVKIFEDKNLAINTMTYVEMFLDENLRDDNVIKKTDIFNLKPDYLEKSQAERDKK